MHVLFYCCSNSVFFFLYFVAFLTQGASFADIMKMTDAFEGSVVRTLRSLDELLRQMAEAAKSVGNLELVDKFTAGSVLIKRDIVFAASLYL